MTSNINSTNKQSAQEHEHLGIMLKVLSVFAFSIMAGLIKFLDGTVPLAQVVFFRSAVALIPLVLFLMWLGDFPSGLKTQHPWKHVRRCVIGTCAMFSAFEVLALLPIAEATALNYLNPIFLVILAMFFLKEQVSKRRWIGVGLGITGLMLMTIPKFSFAEHTDTTTLLGMGLGVLTALLIAAALLQVRQLTQMGENPGAIAFYFAITSSVFGAIAMIIQLDGQVMLAPWQWVCLFAIGLIGGFAQIAMTIAFKHAEASALAPYDYLAIVFAVIIGFVVFDEVPDMLFWLAMPLIILGAVIAKPASKKHRIENE